MISSCTLRVRDINSLIQRIYKTDVNMSFRLDKCSWMISKIGKMITTEGVELPNRNIVGVQETYK